MARRRQRKPFSPEALWGWPGAIPFRKRRKKRTPDTEFLLRAALVVTAIWVVARLLSRPGVDFVLLLCAIGALAYPLWRLHRRSVARGAMLSKVQASVEAQMSALGRRKAQLVRLDAYGKALEEPWLKEVDYFVTNHIEPALDEGERSALSRSRPEVLRSICAQVDGATQGLDAFPNFSGDMNPAQFEAFCAEELRRSGWDARVTPQSHDQGADVVAEKNGTRIVLQCKLYSQPVGNKSVQEVAAARSHERAQFAAVVTNNRYTEAAERLASTNKVALLHYRDLQNLESLLARSIFAPGPGDLGPSH